MANTSENTPFDAQFWTQRYQQQQTGWDMGQVSPPLQAYFEQLARKDLRILIPGAGHAYEAEYLHGQGFTAVTVLDLSAEPLAALQQRCPTFPAQQLVQGDFFRHQGAYDLIVEQTFFCALHPSLRAAYAQQMAQLLVPGGRLVGLLFNIPLHDDQPPFGGHESDYWPLFQPWFTQHTWAACHNSIGPRAGNEWWMNVVRR